MKTLFFLIIYNNLFYHSGIIFTMYQIKIKQYKNLPSTNEELKKMAKQGNVNSGLVLIAESQNAGHGQFGRVFESPKGGLYMSVYIKKELPFDASGLTQQIGEIVQKMLNDLCNLKTDIKPPNDILYKGKKLCGILVESFTFKDTLGIIIGIGLNLNTNVNEFSDEIRETADSVSNILGHTISQDKVVQTILEKIEEV